MREHSTVESSVPDLVREALDEARELIRLEVALAKQEARDEIRAVKAAAILVGGALAATLFGVVMMLVAIVLFWGGAALALVVSLVFFATAGVLGFVGTRILPRRPLGGAETRLRADIVALREKIA